ncbi:response regulator [Desulfonatronovibrio hydrogenovorans]|uniref:response regulator n=1 Tax=Desulfonatronovibrio hydrogenovorans TaxID=53245 RepID=UPI000491F3B3|nr:response regulator [Desulfonatronovibrio hydrogenovorans]
MTEEVFKVLLVEDNPVDVLYFEKISREMSDVSLSLVKAGTLSKAIELAKSQELDLAVCDLGLPDSMGLYTVKQIMAVSPDLPIIVMTNINDEDLGFKAVKMGAQDYLPKGSYNPGLLARSIKYSVERKAYAARQLWSCRERFTALFNNISQGAAFFDKQLSMTHCNPLFSELLGLKGVLSGPDILDQVSPEFLQRVSAVLEGSESNMDMGALVLKKSAEFQPWIRCIPVKDRQGDVQGVLCLAIEKTPSRPLIDLGPEAD